MRTKSKFKIKALMKKFPRILLIVFTILATFNSPLAAGEYFEDLPFSFWDDSKVLGEKFSFKLILRIRSEKLIDFRETYKKLAPEISSYFQNKTDKISIPTDPKIWQDEIIRKSSDVTGYPNTCFECFLLDFTTKIRDRYLGSNTYELVDAGSGLKWQQKIPFSEMFYLNIIERPEVQANGLVEIDFGSLYRKVSPSTGLRISVCISVLPKFSKLLINESKQIKTAIIDAVDSQYFASDGGSSGISPAEEEGVENQLALHLKRLFPEFKTEVNFYAGYLYELK